MLLCPRGRLETGADQKVTAFGGVHNSEALALRGANDDNFVYGGVGAERVGGPDSRVPGDEDSDLHEGSTGCQDSGGEVLLLFLRTATTTAPMAARIRRGEKRFTADQSMTDDCTRGWSCEPHD